MKKWFKHAWTNVHHKTGSEKRYFYRLIWIGCLSACLPVLLIGTLYYYLESSSMKEQIENDTQSSLVLFQERVERILQTIEVGANQIANHSQVRESFSSEAFDEKLFEQLDILEELQVRTLENSFIEEIYYYNHKHDFVLSNEYGFVTYDRFKYQDDIDDILTAAPESSWLDLPVSGEEGYMSFVRALPASFKDVPEGFLVIHVNKNSVLDYFPSQEHKTAFIADHHDTILFHDQENTEEAYEKNESVLTALTANGSKDGMFYAGNPGNEQVLYTYDGNTSFGRMYVLAIPESYITGQIGWFRSMIFYSVLFFLGIGLLLTIYNTRRIYNPIKQLMNYSKSLSNGKVKSNVKSEINIITDCMRHLSQEKEKLGSYIERMEPNLREWFFLQMLENKYPLDAQIKRKCREYHIPFKGRYVVMLVHVDTFSEAGKFEEGDKPAVFFALRNIILELKEKVPFLAGTEIVTIQNSLAVVCRFKKEGKKKEAVEQLKLLSRKVDQSAAEFLALTVSIGIGRIYRDVEKVSVSYQEALSANKYRIYKDTDTVLFIDDVDELKKSGMFFYPREFEQRILRSLRTGAKDQAEQALGEFSDAVHTFDSYNKIYQCFHLLLSSIILDLEKQGNCIGDIFEPDLFGQLKTFHTIHDIRRWFVDRLFPLYQSLSQEAEQTTGRSAVKQVCQHINECISEDVSLTQCAEMVQLTPSYLSRLFKKEVGMNFREYVLIKKVEKAKTLCVESDARTSDIAEAVGYSERNLTRLFQKYVDMTLNQYRNHYRNSGMRSGEG